MSLATYPICGSRYEKDEPWKKICLSCWQRKKREEKSSSGTDELLSLRAEVFKLRLMLNRPRVIEPDMLSRLIRLCHPDRHNGSEASNTATAWFLSQRIG